jgi:hypothetical protein
MTKQWYHEPPFITQVSGGDAYAINVKLRDRTAMHDAHDLITKAFLEAIAAWGSGQIDWQARAEAAESLNARQAEALKPFGEIGEAMTAQSPKDSSPWATAPDETPYGNQGLSFGDFRRARALATESSNAG